MLDSLGGLTGSSLFSFDIRDSTPLSGLSSTTSNPFSSNNSSLTSGSPPSNNSNIWLFGSQSPLSSLAPQLLTTQSETQSQISLPDPLASYRAAEAALDLPLSISDLTGAPLKQMPQTPTQTRLGGVVAASARRGLSYAVASPGAPGTPLGVTQSNGSVPPPKNPKLYKTELCRSWMDQGRCNYGERCQYAHGEHEKRSVPRHPKYKTEMCQSFHKSGYCPYGSRCHFIHSESEVQQHAREREVSLRGTIGQLSPALAALPVAPPTHLTGQALAPGAPLLSRLSSLPSGYNSTGDSPASSSADSGSESPGASFSPGLDLDDNSLPLAMAFGLSPLLQQTAIGRLNRFVPGHGGFSFPSTATNINSTPSESQLGPLLEDIVAWSVDEEPSDGKLGRLPVFAQMSNPPQ